MTFCKHCGKEVLDSDEFCSNCGKSIKDVQTYYKKSTGDNQFATLVERFVAVLIDMIILGVVLAIILIPFGIIALIVSQFGSLSSLFFGVPQLFWYGLWILYFTYFESTSGQTLGKRLVGIKVVTEDNGVLDIGKSLIRNVLRIIDWLPFIFIIGAFLIIFTDKKQRLGDLVAKTKVVKA